MMNINKHLDVIKACRFCFMCRHLSAVGNVTFKEADTPRGRALMLDTVRMNPDNLKNADFCKTVYDAELSASCRYHCVNHYDETGLLLAARQDIVESGNVPANINALAADLKKVDFHVSGKGNVLYYIDEYTGKEISDAFLKLAGPCKTMSGGDCGKALKVLGFADEAAAVFKKFMKAVKASGCKTLVTSSTAAYDALKNDFKADGVKVMHSSEYLAGKDVKKASKSIKAYYLDSDFLKNYNGNIEAPRELLKSAGYKLANFGTNPEESYSAGEGAVVYDKVAPELMKKLSERIYGLMDNQGKDLLVTASPFTKSALKKYNSAINVISIEEAILKAKGN